MLFSALASVMISIALLLPGGVDLPRTHGGWRTATDQPAPLVQATQGRIAGVIRQGTEGADLPAGLEVGLVGFENSRVVMEATTESGADGAFAFEGLEIAAERVYGVFVTYQEVNYFSRAVEFAPDNDTLQLDVVIYEAEAESGNVSAEQVHFLVELDNQQRLAITQVWLFSTSADRTFAPTAESALRIDLPDRLVEVEVETLLEGEVMELGDSLAVRAPIRPDQELNIVSITTLDVGVKEFRMTMPTAVEAVIWLAPEDTLTISGAGVRELGQVEYEGIRLRQYQGNGFQAGEEMLVTFKALRDVNDVIFMLAMIGALLVVAGVALGMWNKRRMDPVDPVYELLTRTIAELDRAHEDGRIDEEVYHRRREALREEALARMKDGHA